MLLQVGCYNVSFEGIARDNTGCYELVIIEEFDENDKYIGKKAYYVIGEIGVLKEFFDNFDNVDKVYKNLPCYQKIRLYETIVMDLGGF